MQQLKFSVIIPVYNAEKYVAACLNSVLTQSYSNFEVILVNDGSTDCSGVLCEEYQSKDSRVIYLRQENTGPAGARNKGMLAASGDYILFLDSDDRLYENVLVGLNQIISKKKNDIYFGTYADYDSKKGTAFIEPFTGDTIIIEEGRPLAILENLLFHHTDFVVVWRNAYRREFLVKGNIVFDESLFGPEDCDFIIRAVMAAESFEVAAIPFCYYTLGREGSISANLKPATISGWFAVSIRWFHYFYNMHDTKYKKSAANLAHKFANMFCDAIAGSGSLSSKERICFEKDIKENEHILQHTHGKKHYIVKMVYYLFGYQSSAYLMFKMYQFNSLMRAKMGRLWKSTYE